RRSLLDDRTRTADALRHLWGHPRVSDHSGSVNGGVERVRRPDQDAAAARESGSGVAGGERLQSAVPRAAESGGEAVDPSGHRDQAAPRAVAPAPTPTQPSALDP